MKAWAAIVIIAAILVFGVTWGLSKITAEKRAPTFATSLDSVQFFSEEEVVDLTFLGGEACGLIPNIGFMAIENSKACESDSDCMVISGECPFSCYIAVNRNQLEVVRHAMSEQHALIRENCRAHCMYRCRPPPAGAICEANECTSVRTNMKMPEKPTFSEET